MARRWKVWTRRMTWWVEWRGRWHGRSTYDFQVKIDVCHFDVPKSGSLHDTFYERVRLCNIHHNDGRAVGNAAVDICVMCRGYCFVLLDRHVLVCNEFRHCIDDGKPQKLLIAQLVCRHWYFLYVERYNFAIVCKLSRESWRRRGQDGWYQKMCGIRRTLRRIQSHEHGDKPECRHTEKQDNHHVFFQ
jgi:hypothetical protein